MSEQNHIDELFKSKLASGEVAGYSETAWNGAASLLDKHYRLLFIKKVLWIGLPIVIGIGSALTYWALQDSPSATSNPAGVAMSESTPSAKPVDSDPDSETYRTSSASTLPSDSGNSSDGSTPVSHATSVSQGMTDQAGSEITANDRVVSTQPDEPLSNRSLTPTKVSAKNQDAPQSTHSLGAQTTKPKAAELHVSSTTLGPSNRSAGSQPDAFAVAEINAEMALMPTFSLNQLQTENRSELTSRNLNQNVSPTSKTQRVEVHLGGGALVGSSVPDAGSNPLGFGFHSSMVGQLHFDGGLYAFTGAIYNARYVDIHNVVVQNGSEISRPSMVHYLDIPMAVGYRVGARHRVSFGMVFSPRLGISTSTKDPLPWNPVIEVADKKLVSNGFANFDAGGVLGYGIQLSDRCFAQAQFRYGLFDITDDDFFQTDDQDDRNHQLRLGLSYRILNR